MLLTTWNRPRLLRQSLPQIETEADSIGAQLVICDDHSSDVESLELIQAAAGRGIPVIRRDEPRDPDAALDFVVQADRKEAFRQLALSEAGVAAINEVAHEGDALMLRNRLFELWDRSLWAAHTSAQLNNLFGFRHVLSAYPHAERILKIDDDVVVGQGAFRGMLETWSRAEADGHDVLTVSAIRTINERIRARYDGYCVTRGICNVAVMYRRDDWERFLEVIPTATVLERGLRSRLRQRVRPALPRWRGRRRDSPQRRLPHRTKRAPRARARREPRVRRLDPRNRGAVSRSARRPGRAADPVRAHLCRREARSPSGTTRSHLWTHRR